MTLNPVFFHKIFKNSGLYKYPVHMAHTACKDYNYYALSVKPYAIKTRKDLDDIRDLAIQILAENGLSATHKTDMGTNGYFFRKAYCREHQSEYEIYLDIRQ